jgi:hypothetical protein
MNITNGFDFAPNCVQQLFVKSLVVAQLAKEIMAFEVALQYSQEPSTSPYPGPDES